jgi:AraC-like DNA-binding protein
MDAVSGCASDVRHALLSSRGRFPSAKEVASSLNMSERTLRRRLDEEATSFMQIVDDVRNHLARQYLSETKLTIAEVGELLGFDDVANFRRAFKRWNGYPPRSMREVDLPPVPDVGTAKAAD